MLILSVRSDTKILELIEHTVHLDKLIRRTPDTPAIFRLGLNVRKEKHMIGFQLTLLHLLGNFLRGLEQIYGDMLDLGWPLSMRWSAGDSIDFGPSFGRLTENAELLLSVILGFLLLNQLTI